MRTRTGTAGIALLAVAALCLPPASSRGGGAGGHPPVSLRGTHLRSVTSSLVGQEFKLHIYLPPGYSDSTRVFPAVYLTDSDAYFGFFRSLAAHLGYGNLIPEIVVVGIAYEEEVGSYMRKRERDLLPAAIPGRPGTGNASAFLGFLRDELLPFVESRYRVDPGDRTIVGMSAGAAFAAYVLFTSPELFDRYVIVSPYLVYGQEILLELESAYASGHASLPARVYTAMGELEPPFARDPWNTLVERLGGRDYPDLELKRELLDGLSHMDVVYAAYANGMKEVFSDRPEALRAVPENYAACAGTYELGAERIRFTVRLDGSRLFISRSGEYWDELIPVADARFGVEGRDEVEFSFVTGGNGRVARMILHQLGMEVPAEKLD